MLCKLITAYLVKKFHVFYGTQMFITELTFAPCPELVESNSQTHVN
jgi:hypothetical protein